LPFVFTVCANVAGKTKYTHKAKKFYKQVSADGTVRFDMAPTRTLKMNVAESSSSPLSATTCKH
jgi:hypothetical protein